MNTLPNGSPAGKLNRLDYDAAAMWSLVFTVVAYVWPPVAAWLTAKGGAWSLIVMPALVYGWTIFKRKMTDNSGSTT